MIGVVIWSDPSDRKAVFWCEDQGDLAFYECGAEDEAPFANFDAGDMVQFDVVNEKRLRRARNPELVCGNAWANLPATLRESQAEKREKGSAEIIAFSTVEARRAKARTQQARLNQRKA